MRKIRERLDGTVCPHVADAEVTLPRPLDREVASAAFTRSAWRDQKLLGCIDLVVPHGHLGLAAVLVNDLQLNRLSSGTREHRCELAAICVHVRRRRDHVARRRLAGNSPVQSFALDPVVIHIVGAEVLKGIVDGERLVDGARDSV